MSASIALLNLSWFTPDGTPLFDRLNLSFGAERTGLIGRNGTGKTTLLRLLSGELMPASGQVQRAASIGVMRQDAMEHPSEMIADLFGIRRQLHLFAKAEAGLANAEELADADWTLPARVEAALLRCGLAAEPQTPLATLSGGQRTRAALAALIFAQPDFLLLDEPTNNLDRAGRRAMLDFVSGWSGGAIIVSHDRELLAEMDAMVELTSLGATRYGGNYSAYRDQKDAELGAAERDLAHAAKYRHDAALRARQAAERKARKDGAGQRLRAKGGQPKILMDAAKGRAEASAGAGLRLRDDRRQGAEDALVAAREKIEILQPIRMDMALTAVPAGKIILRLSGVTGGYHADCPLIINRSLTITGPERLVIAGPNGSGKTTLLKLITGELSAQQGSVERMVPFALLDQHVGLLDPDQTLLANFRRRIPAADTHLAHAALARFGFRSADALRLAGELSGGERVRAGLACALGGVPPPMLLILDEPTNHLDLDGIAALEAAMAAYDGAILVVSHDEAFIQSLAPDRIIHLGE